MASTTETLKNTEFSATGTLKNTEFSPSVQSEKDTPFEIHRIKRKFHHGIMRSR